MPRSEAESRTGSSSPPDHIPVVVENRIIQEHGARQGDLPEIGSQGVVSEILSGKRSLNTRQVKALGLRFGLSPVVFI